MRFRIGANAGAAILALGSHAWGADSPGPTLDALPGLHRIGVPTSAEHGITLGGGAGYGITEPLGTDDAVHHRVGGVLSVGAVPVDWLQFGLRLDGRLDIHSSDSEGRDTSAVGEPSLLVRAGYAFTPAVSAGLELNVRFPGADAPSISFDATTLEARSLLMANASDAVSLHAGAGFRWDNTAATVSDPELLGFGDRVSLGVSEFDALLFGLGVLYHPGALELFAEVTFEPLLGADAPAALQAPLRAALGARYRAIPGLYVGGVAEFGLGQRPDLSVTAPLVVVEPRAQLLATLAYRFGAHAAEEPARPPPPSPPAVTPQEEKMPAGEPAPPPPAWIQVLSPEGTAVTDAVVLFEAAGNQTTFTWKGSRYEADSVPEGSGTLFVSAEGYEDVERKVSVGSGRPLELSIQLEPALPAGQIRGLVRSFAGKPVPAEITIEPLGRGTRTEADGRFSVDVPPGEYTVVITAEGFKKQERRVVVQQKGVVILNADLIEAK